MLTTVAAIGLIAGTHQVMAATATGNITAVVRSTISVSETTAMNFGEMLSPASAGTLVLAPNGTLTPTGIVHYGSNVPGVMTVQADAGSTITVSIADTTINSGPNSMTVTNFTTSSTPGGYVVDGTGHSVINVGATLNVSAGQALGAYAGTYTITVNYQ